ncbi:hypothetical protein D3C72_1233480 [compost metagenome]
MRQVHVHAVGFSGTRQERATGLFRTVDDLVAVALVQVGRGAGIRGGVEFVAGQPKFLGRGRHELEQALGTALGVVGIRVEVAAGLDIGKPQEIFAGDAAALCLLFDDVENFFTIVGTGHLWLLR